MANSVNSLALIYAATMVLPKLQADPPQAPTLDVLSPVVRCLWKNGLISSAVIGIQLLDRQEGADVEALSMLGFWHLHSGDSAKAKAIFERGMRLQPDEVSLHLGYAYALFYLQKYMRAAKEFELLATSNPELDSPPKMFKAATQLANQQKPEEIMIHPLPNLPSGMAEMMQTRLLYGPAAACEFLPPLPQIIDEGNLPLCRLQIEYLLEQQKNPQAISLADKILGSFPFDGKTLYFKGIASRRLEQFKQSQQAFAQAIIHSPLEVQAWAALGAGCLEQEDWENAWRNYRVAVFLDSENPNTWSDLGLCQSLLNHNEEAEEAFTNAIDLFNDHSFENYFNRGAIRLQLKKIYPAQLDLCKAIAINPQHPRAAEVRSIIKGFQRDNRFAFGAFS